MQLADRGCATFRLSRGRAVFTNVTSTPSNYPFREMCNFVYCAGQLPSNWCATFPLPVDVLLLFAASANFLVVDVQLRILSRPNVYQWCATFDRTPHGCVVFSSSNRPKPPLFLRFTTLAPCLYAAFHYPREYGIFTIQLSLPVRCATSHAFLANCLADYV